MGRDPFESLMTGGHPEADLKLMREVFGDEVLKREPSPPSGGDQLPRGPDGKVIVKENSQPMGPPADRRTLRLAEEADRGLPLRVYPARVGREE